MNIYIKTKDEIKIMAEAGKKLHEVREALFKAVEKGVNAMEIEELAMELIYKLGAEPAFTKVEDYKWATCVNLNDSVVHGIPKKDMVFAEGDIVSVDVGLVYNGFNSDTSFTKLIGNDPKKAKMLEVGRQSLNNAIKQARPGNYVRDISRAMSKVLNKHGYRAIESLTGHGIGKKLHEDPLVPCYVSGSFYESVKLVEGMVLAIEVMYTEGKPGIKLDKDGWTLRTKDGKMSALFEETVAITKNGPVILT